MTGNKMRDPEGPMTVLDILRDYAEKNYAWTQQRLGDATELVQDLIDLYDVMADIAQSGPAKLGAGEFVALPFLLTCRYELAMASISIMRAHLLASYPHTRRAIETCAFARRVKTTPALIELWGKAGDDEVSYKKYWNQFRAKDTFPKSHRLLWALYERYEQCSRRSHASIVSVSLQAKIESTDSGALVEVGYFQIDEADKIEPLRTLVWTLDIHFGILRVFAEDVLAALITNNPARWAVRRNAVDARLGGQIGRLKALFAEKAAAAPPSLIWLPT